MLRFFFFFFFFFFVTVVENLGRDEGLNVLLAALNLRFEGDSNRTFIGWSVVYV
jgi:hypothetical protein